MDDQFFGLAVTMMKGFGLFSIVFVISIFYLDAFLPLPKYAQNHAGKQQRKCDDMLLSKPVPYRDCFAVSGKTTLQYTRSVSGGGKQLTHDDILWKLRPPPETSLRKRLWLRFAANVIRLDCKLKRQDPPLVLCPKGGQAVLEAYYRPYGGKYEKIAKFGFTTERGPSNEPIQDTIHEFYDIEKNRYNIGIGAIIYMFVEPQYRKKNVGTLALEVISMIHSLQACDFTVLVANDNGSGKLVDWYEKHGYKSAPKLQDVMGSPNAKYGVTMISPTQQTVPNNLCLKWW